MGALVDVALARASVSRCSCCGVGLHTASALLTWSIPHRRGLFAVQVVLRPWPVEAQLHDCGILLAVAALVLQELAL